MKAVCYVASFAFLFPATTLPQSVFNDFNAPGQFADSFNIYQNPSPGVGSPYVQSATGGLANSGAITLLPPGSTVTADSTAINKTQSFDFSQSGSQLQISEFVNVIPVSGGGGRLLQLGFVNENTSGMNNNPGLGFVSLRLSTVGSTGNTYTPQFQDKTATGATSTFGLSPNVTLTAGDWYELSGSFLNLGGGKFQASGALTDYGPTGQGVPITAFTFAPQTYTNVDLTADATVWPAFRSFHNDGAQALDNFSAQAVPEPGTIALVSTGLALLAVRGACRRR